MVHNIKDSGIGIPADKHKIIFEKFERLTSSYKGKYKGTGLGLYSVKDLVNDLRGEVTVESEQGKGAVFICDIPMGFSEEKIDNKSAAQPVKSHVGFCLSSSPDVLLVEDSPIIQLAATSLLEKLNCFVDTVGSGEDAIAHCKEKSYDLILVDIGLPGINGFDAAYQIKQLADCKLTPIVALTAHATHEVNEQCQAVGINEVVSKPLLQEKAILLLKQFTTQEYEEKHTDNMASNKPYHNTQLDNSIIDINDSISKQGSLSEAQKYCFLLKDNLISSLETFSELLEKNNLDVLAKEVHKLKGALSLVSLPSLQRAVENFDCYLKNRGDKPINKFIIAIESEAERFLDELNKI